MTAIIASVARVLISKATVRGTRKVSMTKVAAASLVAVGPDWTTLLPGVVARDPEAIGRLVLILITYACTLWGRVRADR